MPPTIHLSSFKRWHEDRPKGLAYSVAVYQPRQYASLPEASVFNILDENHNWIRPRDFIPESHDRQEPSRAVLNAYFRALLNLYDNREDEIRQWLADHRLNRTIYLLCWCPYDRAAQRQLLDFGSFVCHTAAVGHYLKQLGYRVSRDSDRKRMVVPSVKSLSAHT